MPDSYFANIYTSAVGVSSKTEYFSILEQQIKSRVAYLIISDIKCPIYIIHLLQACFHMPPTNDKLVKLTMISLGGMSAAVSQIS